MFGSTKEGEYWRTIEMLLEKCSTTKEQLMYVLYFLYDSQYDNQDLKAMADQINNSMNRR